MIRVLMTGAGAPGAAGIIHCLKQESSISLTVADADPNAIGKYLSDDFEQIPKAGDASFSDTVLEVCRSKKINVILPLVTKELFPFSKNKNRFESIGTKIIVSSEKAIEIANNKSQCYRYLQDNGIEVPAFFIVRSVEEFIHAASSLGHPQTSFCFKPSVSNGSRGVRIVDDSFDESFHLFHEKPYNLHISYAQAVSILSSRPFPELLLSDYLPGPEYSVDCLADNGRSVLIVPRLRKKMINGISVQGEFIDDGAIINYCRKIIESIGLHGSIGLQVKMTKENKPLLLEVNPRVQGTIVAALGAGVNLPLLAVQQACDIPIKEKDLQVKWGTGFSRYWKEVFF
jgi:carbamoyl-phosphate synthase large subunit